MFNVNWKKQLLCLPLNRITLGQHETDNNNRMIHSIDVFCLLFWYNDWNCFWWSLFWYLSTLLITVGYPFKSEVSNSVVLWLVIGDNSQLMKIWDLGYYFIKVLNLNANLKKTTFMKKQTSQKKSCYKLKLRLT